MCWQSNWSSSHLGLPAVLASMHLRNHRDALLQGPPPGFGSSVPTSNGNAPPGFPSHSGSDSSDHHGQIWPSSQAPPQQWASFDQSHSSPLTAAGSGHSMHSMQQSQSAGPAGYQPHTFAMPGLSDLQTLREQAASEHSLFSGLSNQPGFPQTQLRQRSRFQFAQDPPLSDSPPGDGPTNPSMFSSSMSPAAQQPAGQYEQHHGQLQQLHQRQHSELFPSGSGFGSSSLFAGRQGMANSGSVPHQLGMHAAADCQADGFAHAAPSLMGMPGQPPSGLTCCCPH